MNILDTIIGLSICLMGASQHDALKTYKVSVDANGQLSTVVLESAKVRVTIERLPQTIMFNGMNITNIILTTNFITANVFKTNGLIQWLPGGTAEDRPRQ